MATPTTTDVTDARTSLSDARAPSSPATPTSPTASNAASPHALRRRRRGWRTWVGWLAPVVVLGGAGYGYWRYAQAHKPPDITYKTAPAEARRITGKVTASGTLQAVVTVQVGSQVSGRIAKINVDFNSPVKKGELIAKIDPALFEAAVQQARANYTQGVAGVVQAKAKLLDADRVYKRTQALNAQTLASQADVETAETARAVAQSNVDVAEASLEQAKAQLHQAEVNLSYTSIFAPIDGVVISRAVDVGQTVAASLQAPTLFTIAEDLRKMQVNTNVAEGDVGRLQAGMRSYFTVDAFPGQRFEGKISQIRNAATTLQNVVTYNALIDVENLDLKLRPGMTANVTVIFDQRDHVLSVSNAALRFRPPPSMPGASNPPAGAGAAPGAAGAPPTAANGATAGGAPPAAAGRHAQGREAREGRGDKDKSDDTRTLWVLHGNEPSSITVHTGLTDGTITEITGGDLHEGDLTITDAISASNPAPASTGGPQGGGMRRMF